MTVEREVVTTASFAQRSMWAFALRYRAAHLNEMVIPWHVRGPLDADVLQDALTDLSRRHPTLRARLAYEHGQLHQIVMPADPVVLRHTTIEGDSIAAKLDAARVALSTGLREHIDVLAGPTLIARLLRLGEDQHVLCLSIHHAMCDGWSIQIMERDLAAYYQARLSGTQAQLPPLVEQYSDVAQREAATYAGGGFAEEVRYWQIELKDLPAPVALPTRGVRKGNRDWRCDTLYEHKPAEFMRRVRESARQQRVSPFALSLAALAVVLRHRSGSADQLIGVPTLNRWSEEAMQFVGYATSLMPLRVRLEGSLSVSAMCKRVNVSVREMLAYGRVPLEVLLRETALARMASNVFPIWCQFLESRPAFPIQAAGLSFELLATERSTLLAELDLDLSGHTEGLRCDMAYRKSLFERADIEHMMADYIVTLEQMMADPAQRLNEVLQRLDLRRTSAG